MKCFFATIIILVISATSAFASNWDKADIGALDSSGEGTAVTLILLALLGLSYLFAKWIENK